MKEHIWFTLAGPERSRVLFGVYKIKLHNCNILWNRVKFIIWSRYKNKIVYINLLQITGPGWHVIAVLMEHSLTSEECCGFRKVATRKTRQCRKTRRNYYFVRVSFFINAKQEFCENVKVLKQSRHKKRWVECVSNKFLIVPKIIILRVIAI